MSKSITLIKAAKEIGITEHTIRKWEDILALNVPRENNRRLFSPELVQNLRTLNELLTELDISLGEWLSWVQVLHLNHPLDVCGAPDWQDPYWGKYYRKLAKDLKAGTVDVHELTRWEWELKTEYPRDAYDNIALTRDWCRWLQTVQERYADGKDTYWVLYNVESPKARPQVQSAIEY